jgi:hypothetical protein
MSGRAFKQILTLPERLLLFAQRGREQAQAMSAGKDRDNILQKVRQAEAAIDIEECLRFPAIKVEVPLPAPKSGFLERALRVGIAPHDGAS